MIASQSINFVERYLLDAGFTTARFTEDYGFDLDVTTYDANGYIEVGRVLIQCKASDHLPDPKSVTHIPFYLDIRDLNLWSEEPAPVFLCMFDAKRRRAYWIHLQGSILRGEIVIPGPRSKSVLLQIPVRNRMNLRAALFMQRCNAQTRKTNPPLRFRHGEAL